ncbi:MAG: ATP-grasp domain-containing protein [Thermodesulfobacteriota bacterium]
MNMGIITVRGAHYHPNRRLREAAIERGHQITLVHPYRLCSELKDSTLSIKGIHAMASLDVVLPRQGATVGDSCLALIRHFSLMDIPVVNDLDSIRLTKNKFFTLQALAKAHIPVLHTIFVNSTKAFHDAVIRLGGRPVVVKQVSSRQGEGVILLDKTCDEQMVTRKHLNKRKGLLVQRYIPPEGRQDIRVLVVGKNIEGAMELRPKKGDFRANYHLSKESRPRDLTPELRKIALDAMEAVGLEIGGVDIMVEKDGKVNVIEVNYSPGFKGLEAATGLDIAGRIVDYVADTYGAHKQV